MIIYNFQENVTLKILKFVSYADTFHINVPQQIDIQGCIFKVLLEKFPSFMSLIHCCTVLTNILFRSQKVAGTMQTLLGGDEIYHYHSKVYSI